MTITRILLGTLAAVSVVSSASAALVVDRGLPTANLNNVSGANRSNVAWGYGQNPEQYFTGDDFTLGATGDVNNPIWQVTKVTTWAIAGANGDLNFSLGDRYENVRLFMGGLSGISQVSAGNFALGQSQTDNADITISRVTYANGDGYDSFGNFAQIWKVEFSNLNLIVNPGELTQFGVTGTARDQATRTWFNHASNAGLSGSPQQGSDDLYRYHDLQDLLSGSGLDDSNGNGWDKSSDINVLVEAQAVPEPATMSLLALGAGAAIAKRRRNR